MQRQIYLLLPNLALLLRWQNQLTAVFIIIYFLFHLDNDHLVQHHHHSINNDSKINHLSNQPEDLQTKPSLFKTPKKLVMMMKSFTQKMMMTTMMLFLVQKLLFHLLKYIFYSNFICVLFFFLYYPTAEEKNNFH